ncbi:MAG: hypothetical protein IIY81_00930 [Lachnospiraceae bacterium]|nr:hypothetical protein [Lachnospiraceae bacterium]
MKTIMIVPELPCKNCHKYEPNACVECFNKNGEKEQVPENWEDLKKKALSLPKRKNGIYVIIRHYVDTKQEFLSIRRGNYEICQVTHNRIRFFSLAMAIDISHSWMIIKGIMEE